MNTAQLESDTLTSSQEVHTLELANPDEGYVTSIATGPEPVDESLDALPGFLGFMMRGRSVHWQLLERLQATPYWIVSVSLHVAAILILASWTVKSRDVSVEDLMLDVRIGAQERPVINLAKIRQVFDPQSVEAEKPMPLAPQLQTPPSVEPEDEDIEQDAELEIDFEVIPDDDFLETEGELDDEVELTIGGEAMGVGEHPIGNGGLSFNPRGLNGYGSVIQNLGRRLHDSSAAFRNRALLVWLVDRSVSMKDDQEAIKEQLWEMDRRFRQGSSRAKLKQAVVAFGDRPEVLLKPDDNIEKVMATFDAIRPSPPNTAENVMAAIIYCAKGFQRASGAKKAIILVDDDSADDTQLTEEALKALRTTRTTLYVINRESPFQEVEGYENYSFTDEKGERYYGTGVVKRGPETAKQEVPRLRWGAWNWPTNWGHSQVLSGFGIYDQSRMAFQTGGAYYILSSGDSAAPASSEYDWKAMELYRPELVSRKEYLNRVESNPFRRVVAEVGKAWNSKSLSIRTKDWSPEILERNVKRCEQRLVLADKMIAVLQSKAILPSSRLERLKTSRRWPANADLVLAEMCLAKYRIRQYLYALHDFQRRVKSVPEDHVLVWEHSLPPRSTPEEAKDRDACIKAFQFVAERHPGTPWGSIATSFDPSSTKYLHGYRIRHKPGPKPFMALIEFKDGSQIEAKVLKMDEKKVTYSTSKGTRTAPKDTIKKITPLDRGPFGKRPRI